MIGPVVALRRLNGAGQHRERAPFIVSCFAAAAYSQAQRQYGNKWRTIVDEYLPWRSPNDLKNYCNQYILGKGSHVRYC